MRFLILFLLLIVGIEAAYLEESRWKKGETFLTFLETYSIPLSLYYELDSEDKEVLAEIQSNTRFHFLKDDKNKIEQILIPLNDELQAHIIKNKQTNTYKLKMTPIAHQEEFITLSLEIKNSPYQDIVDATNNHALAYKLISAYKKSINFKALKEGDRLVIFYNQKRRLGKIFGEPTIEAAMIEVHGKQNYLFHDNGKYYTDTGKELEGYFLKIPLRTFKRISSKFTYKRWHPILKRYRAHLGIDYAAKTGTKVYSAGDGRISFVGRKRGYGKTIEVNHSNGYKTLYAHLSKFYRKTKRGKRVKKGELIGYVGNTGISTGSHLHFGLYKNNRAINPNNVVKVTKNKISGKEEKKFFTHVKIYKKKFVVAMENPSKPHKEKNFKYIVSLERNAKKSSVN